MTTPMPDGLLALLADLEARRIGIAMRDGCDVAKAEHAAVGLDRRLRDCHDPVERTRHPQRHALGGRLDDARGHHRVLPRQRLEDLVGGDAERRELGIREFDEDLFVLGSV
jgi:hypothetical protein